MASEDMSEWFRANGAFFYEMEEAATALLVLIADRNWTALRTAAGWLLAVLVRGQQLPPLPDVEAQRHFAAGIARYRDAAETLVGTDDEAELARGLSGPSTHQTRSSRWMEHAIERAQGLG